MPRKREKKERALVGKRAWVPTAKHWAYFVVFEEAVQTGGKVYDHILAPKAGINRKTIAAWREQPEFHAWMEERCGLRLGTKNRLAFRAMTFAEKGSVEHLKWLAQVFGWYAQKDPEAVGQGGSTTVIVAPPGSDEKFVSEQKASIVVRV